MIAYAPQLKGLPHLSGKALLRMETWQSGLLHRTYTPASARAYKPHRALRGFETTISTDLGDSTQSEPTAVLLQNSLAELGIKTRIEKVPGANFRNAMLEKRSNNAFCP